MSCEYYTLKWDEKKLRLEEAKDKPALDSDLRPIAPWQIHSCFGDDNKLWCEVFRTPGQSGGIFVLRDFDETLLIASAATNLDFVQGVDHFARITSNARYAADIFEHNDDDVDDE